MADRNNRKIRIGVVEKTAMDKTVTVKVNRSVLHPLYKRVVRKNKNYLTHDEKNECGVGDTVEIMETRPLSKNKRWRLSKILEKAK